jgi:hypothetical protein
MKDNQPPCSRPLRVPNYHLALTAFEIRGVMWGNQTLKANTLERNYAVSSLELVRSGRETPPTNAVQHSLKRLG